MNKTKLAATLGLEISNVLDACQILENDKSITSDGETGLISVGSSSSQ